MENVKEIPHKKYLFNRLEVAGSLGDLGTLLPLAIGMIVINGLDPIGVFFIIGAFYILSGIYYGVTVPVQPMKVIGAYSIAMGLSANVITSSGLLMGIFMLIIGISGVIHIIGRYTPKSVVRGVQFSVGMLLVIQGIKFILGTSSYQITKGLVEPYLSIQSIGFIPISVILGVISAIVTLLLLENKRVPAALVVVIAGLIIGTLLSTQELKNVKISFYFPSILPFGIPSTKDLVVALFTLALPQIPMTIGNAVIANVDLTRKYFGEKAKMTSYKALSISMGLANIFAFLFGGMPVCHGAGGLAAHYRFGARTAGSNIIIGTIFLILAIFLGKYSLSVIRLLPFSILGILLIFAGVQLALTISDISEKNDLFIIVIMLGITMAINLAIAFIAGILLAYAFKKGRLKI